jgi:transposase
MHTISKFKIGNDRAGFERLEKHCEKLLGQDKADTVIFGIEPAGHYWRNLTCYLEECGYVVRLINPFTLKRQRDGDDLMRRKNDYRDAAKVAELLSHGKYTWTQLPQGDYAELRVAHETYQQLVIKVSRVKIQLTTALDNLFPEFRSVFKKLDGQTALTVLQTCPNPKLIVQLSEEEFIRLMHSAHQSRRLMRKKLAQLHAMAPLSVGISRGTTALTQQVHILAAQLTFLSKQIEQARTELRYFFLKCPESQYLMSIPGLGEINGAGLLAHIGDIHQYSSVKQLPKLAGIVPIENSSARRAAAKTPMSKKGRSGLRSVAYRAVIALLAHNSGFQHYTQALQDRDPHHNPLTKREAIGASMNKLLRIVYALLSKCQYYDPLLAFAH